MTKKELEKRIKEIRGFFEGVENFESIENEYVDLIYDLWKEKVKKGSTQMDKKEIAKAIENIQYNLDYDYKNDCLSFIQNFIIDNKDEIPAYVIDQLLTVFQFIVTNEKENANEQIKELLYIVRSDNG